MPAWLAALLTRKMLICVFTGFSSGLPLYLLLNPKKVKNNATCAKLRRGMPRCSNAFARSLPNVPR